MIKKLSKNTLRTKRHLRVRKKIFGTAECPRLNVYRSLTNIYAQIIDDENKKTLVSASSLDEKFKGTYSGNKTVSFEVGKLLAEKCKKAGVKDVVFDRGGYLYHGRVQQLANGAREGGLSF